MSSNLWMEQGEKFHEVLNEIQIPDDILSGVPCAKVKGISDLDAIPKEGGCYWIWTTEPVLHTLHKHPLPKRFDEGEIIYNGYAQDDVRGRIRHHLFGEKHAGWSGISMDIFDEDTRSHRKKALAPSGKVPYLVENRVDHKTTRNHVKGDVVPSYKPIRHLQELRQLYLSNQERIFVEIAHNVVYFRNGINITEDKHAPFEFRVYHLTGVNPLYSSFVEKEWRIRHNVVPRLCSYTSGR